jgi:hypothetical protein
MHGQNILVQFGGSGELLSREIDEALRVSEGDEELKAPDGLESFLNYKNGSDPPSGGSNWSIGPPNKIHVSSQLS